MWKPTKIDLLNGIVIDLKNGRDGKVIELNVEGMKKKLSQQETNDLIDGLVSARQWFKYKPN